MPLALSSEHVTVKISYPLSPSGSHVEVSNGCLHARSDTVPVELGVSLPLQFLLLSAASKSEIGCIRLPVRFARHQEVRLAGYALAQTVLSGRRDTVKSTRRSILAPGAPYGRSRRRHSHHPRRL